MIFFSYLFLFSCLFYQFHGISQAITWNDDDDDNCGRNLRKMGKSKKYLSQVATITSTTTTSTISITSLVCILYFCGEASIENSLFSRKNNKKLSF